MSYMTTQEKINEAIKDAQQRIALKDLEIMRLREALEEAKHSNSTEKFETMYDAVMYTPINYDDLMAWHEAQLGEPVAWMSVSGFEGGDGHEFIDEKLHNNDIPLYAKKG